MSEDSIRPLITGGGGQVGSAVAEFMAAEYPATVTATRTELDLTDGDRVRMEVERLEPTLIINCAAMTDVDGCEGDPHRAFQVNHEGPAHLAHAARAVGARLIHISTDFVFDGEKRTPYREQDPALPLSVYGRSKLRGEVAVLETNPDSLVVRSSWVYGGAAARFVRTILDRARRNLPLRVVTDQVGGPTYRVDLAGAILLLATLPVRGILHFANAGQCSRHEFAREIVRLAGLETPVEPIRDARVSGRAPRPPYSVLDTGRYREVTGAPVRDWRQALAEYLAGGGPS